MLKRSGGSHWAMVAASVFLVLAMGNWVFAQPSDGDGSGDEVQSDEDDDESEEDADGRSVFERNLNRRFERSTDLVRPGQVTIAPGLIRANPDEADGADEVGEQLEGEDGDHLGDLADAGGMVSLDFDEPVQLIALIELVSDSLGINVIISDTTIQARQVTFRAPIEIEVDQMLAFLSSILDNEGFALQYDPQGYYTVRQSAQIRFNESDTRIYQSPLVSPSSLRDAVVTTMGADNPETQRIRFGVLEELGLLVVTAPPRSLSGVDAAVQMVLDRYLEDFSLHRFPLEQLSAVSAIDRIVQLHGQLMTSSSGGGGVGGVAQGPGTAPSRLQAAGRVGVSGGGPTATGLLADRLMVAAQGNAVLFRGTDDEAEIVADLVEQVDRVSLLLARRYIAGTVLGDVLKASERLGLGPSEYVSEGSGRNTGFRNRQTPVNQQTLGTTGEEVLHGSGFLVDEETGTFVYFGTPSQHVIVEQLVEQFREQEVKNEIVIRVYELQYARASGSGGLGEGGGGGGGDSEAASGIVDILNELIASPEGDQARAPLLPQGSGAALALQNAGIPAGEVDVDSLFVATEENTTIVADDANNQIIIRAPEIAQAQFEKLIRQLDKRRPQVLIEAHIVSIGVDSDFDWVTDFGLQTGSISLFSGDQTSFDTEDGGFGLPSGPASGGLSLGLLNTETFRFGLRTLAADGTARVSSRPEVVVNDNSAATIIREDIEPFATTERDSAGVTTTTQGGTAQAGTRLLVRPQIGAGGDVILQYSLELSAFDLSRQQANLQPPTSSDSFESIVTLPTDTTLVVGGLEFEDFSQSDSGIPLLKDIPFFGNAFKDYAQRSSRQRIYVFITPRVLDDVNHSKLKLLSENRRELTGVDGGWPELVPAVIPIPTYRPLDERVLRRNFITE